MSDPQTPELRDIVTGVKFVRREVRALLWQYFTIEDCLNGERAVKAKGQRYLPDPSPKVCVDDERSRRYRDYLCRALFTNYVRRTMGTLTGQVFAKTPEIEVPEQLKPVIANISGDGVSAIQQSKSTLETVLAYSRAGLFVDFPRTEGAQVSQKQVNSGEIRATVTLYKAAQIRNWRTEDIGAEEVLTMVVLEEVQQVPALGKDKQLDEFALVDETWFRVLKLNPRDGSGVVVEVWKPVGGSADNGGAALPTGVDGNLQEYKKADRYEMRGKDGTPLLRIPFKFIGLTSNSTQVESPAFYDMCAVNLAHYRNSADYEEACFIVGQPTPWASGLSEAWLKDQMGGVVAFGSRGGIPLPTGGQVGLLQAEESTMLQEAMKNKQEQMASLGAKFLEQAAVDKTATETRIDASAEGSMLMSAARNVSAAYLWALSLCAAFIGVEVVLEAENPTIKFKLNDDFDLSNLTAEEITQVMALKQDGDISWTELRKIIRAKLPLDDDKVAKKEIDDQAKADADFEAEKTGALTKAVTDNSETDPTADEA